MNIEKLRAETPGTNHVIHFNNAGASLMPKPVSKTVVSYLRHESLYGGYETAQRHSTELNDIYSSISTFINAQSTKEIAILENATAAWNMAFYAIDFKDSDRILTSKAEYASNYISYLRLQQKSDITIDFIPNDEFGQTSVESLKNMIDDDVKLISITHIPTNSGLVNPVEEIGTIAKEYNCLYLVDACQSVGHYPVDVQQIGCDMLSATGRKYLRGPRGTGFLYVNNDQISDLIPPFLDLHSAEWTAQNRFEIRDDARRFENWEANYAGILGLKKAVEYANELGIKQIWNRITDLAEKLRWQLAELPSVTVHDIGETKCGIVTFAVEEVEAEHVKAQLADQNINVSISTRNSTLLDMQERELDEVIRASVHYYNTIKEIEDIVAAVKVI
jgi:selenocysteine lyase/cysteine desulfurase